MKIVFIGDIVARAGREAVLKHLPYIREKLSPDCIIVNAENSAHGIGLTPKICDELFEAGCDVITTGNHVWDQREIIPYIQKNQKVLRPLNYPAGTAGHGFVVADLKSGQRILVVNAMARLFMDALDDPFAAMDALVRKYPLMQSVHASFLDFHGEATSEKMAMAHYLDGRISAVVGTHTHLPTADCQVLDGGTAFQADAGMTGDYNSVIGMKKDVPIQRFTRKFSIEKLSPADSEATLCGTFVETDDKTGLAKEIRPIRLGPRLINCC